MRKCNDGFTLVELVVVILVGSIVTLAGTTVLLLGLRMNKSSTDTATRQNTARIVMTVLEDLAAEENITIEGTDSWKVKNNDETVLFSYKDSSIYAGDFESASASPLMTGIDSASVKWDENNSDLLVISITIADETYTSSVYCRLAVPEGIDEASEIMLAAEAAASAVSFSLTEADGSPSVPAPDFTGVRNARGREAFLDVLTAEEGSTGYSLETGEYFSEWYIGGYEGNPGWNEDTPWCACFLSWALDRCGTYLDEVPKYAHVDEFRNYFGIASWKSHAPDPGDIIFFDWIENETQYPQHVGVVVSADESWVHTIEGNADGRVAAGRYSTADPRILGYGVLRWAQDVEN